MNYFGLQTKSQCIHRLHRARNSGIHITKEPSWTSRIYGFWCNSFSISRPDSTWLTFKMASQKKYIKKCMFAKNLLKLDQNNIKTCSLRRVYWIEFLFGNAYLTVQNIALWDLTREVVDVKTQTEWVHSSNPNSPLTGCLMEMDAL